MYKRLNIIISSTASHFVPYGCKVWVHNRRRILITRDAFWSTNCLLPLHRTLDHVHFVKSLNVSMIDVKNRVPIVSLKILTASFAGQCLFTNMVLDIDDK